MVDGTPIAMEQFTKGYALLRWRSITLMSETPGRVGDTSPGKQGNV